jgi:dihydrofolate reductase
MKPLTIIAAMTKDRVIGKANGLPWRVPEDLKHFKTSTQGHAIIMGRKTFESVGVALPRRRNIVVTRQTIDVPGIETTHTLEEAIALARTTDAEPFIIGGGELYRAAMPLATKLSITWIDRKIEGDTTFPEINLTEWKETSRRKGEEPDVEFVIYERV